MASSSCSPPPAASQGVGPPPAASQGLASQLAVEHFNDFSVATYNVGASQDISFTAPGKMEPFKLKLVVSNRTY